MKSNVEYSEAEFIALVTLADKITSRLFAMYEADQGRPVSAAAVPLPVTDEPDMDLGAPAATVAVVDDKVKADIAAGRGYFRELLDLWVENFGVEGAPQPDRGEAMRKLSTGPSVMPVLTFVGSVGGIQHAVDTLLRNEINKSGTMPPEAFEAFSNNVAGTICQVSSIFFPELASYYEYRDIYKKVKHV